MELTDTVEERIAHKLGKAMAEAAAYFCEFGAEDNTYGQVQQAALDSIKNDRHNWNDDCDELSLVGMLSIAEFLERAVVLHKERHAGSGEAV